MTSSGNPLSRGYSYAEYKKRMQEQITISKLVNQQIRSKILVNDQDIDAFIKEKKEFAESAEAFRIGQILLRAPKDAADRPMIEERARSCMKGFSRENVSLTWQENILKILPGMSAVTSVFSIRGTWQRNSSMPCRS